MILATPPPPNIEAAMVARKNALQTYLSYRRNGGRSHSPRAAIFPMVIDAIQQDQSIPASKEIPGIIGVKGDLYAKALIPRLQSILNGDRSPNLAFGEDILYIDSVELQLLLEKLSIVETV